MPSLHKNRKNSTGDLNKIRSHHDEQGGASCAKKMVKHGDHVDYVRDGSRHRIHDKDVKIMKGQKEGPKGRP